MVVLKHGDGSVETTCKLRTLEHDMPLNIADEMHTKKVNQVIMSGAALKEAFAELDWSADAVELRLANSAPHFRLRTSSQHGTAAVAYPNDSDVFTSFSVRAEQAAHYKLCYLAPAAKGLAEAATVSLKTNSEHLLLIQMSINLASVTSAPVTAFVDFYTAPLELPVSARAGSTRLLSSQTNAGRRRRQCRRIAIAVKTP